MFNREDYPGRLKTPIISSGVYGEKYWTIEEIEKRHKDWEQNQKTLRARIASWFFDIRVNIARQIAPKDYFD